MLNKTTLEGIEEHAVTFNKLFKTISSKTYDALDHRSDYYILLMLQVEVLWCILNSTPQLFFVEQ